MASYRVDLTRSAAKDLRRIDRSEVITLYTALERRESEPRPRGTKKLTGSDRTYRIRVGDYRMV
jgi:mRNA interferase RelE/StbE